MLMSNKPEDILISKDGEGDPKHCPYCKSNAIQSTDMLELVKVVSDSIVIHMVCDNCQMHWVNYFDLMLQEMSPVTPREQFTIIYKKKNMLPELSHWISETFGNHNVHADWLIHLHERVKPDANGDYHPMIYGMVHTAFDKLLEMEEQIDKNI